MIAQGFAIRAVGASIVAQRGADIADAVVSGEDACLDERVGVILRGDLFVESQRGLEQGAVARIATGITGKPWLGGVQVEIEGLVRQLEVGPRPTELDFPGARLSFRARHGVPDEHSADQQADRRQSQHKGGRKHDRSAPSRPLDHSFQRRGTMRQNGLVVEKPIQIVGKLQGGCVPVHRFLGHALEDDCLQISRNERVEPAGRARVFARDLVHERLDIVRLESWPERQHFVERDAQGVDVSPVVDDAPPRERLLGAHVPNRAQQIARDRQARIPLQPR